MRVLRVCDASREPTASISVSRRPREQVADLIEGMLEREVGRSAVTRVDVPPEESNRPNLTRIGAGRIDGDLAQMRTVS